jgi:hypothetical protein
MAREAVLPPGPCLSFLILNRKHGGHSMASATLFDSVGFLLFCCFCELLQGIKITQQMILFCAKRVKTIMEEIPLVYAL